MKFDKIAEAGIGLLLITGTITSPIPGDELAGVPIGSLLLLDAFSVKRVR